MACFAIPSVLRPSSVRAAAPFAVASFLLADIIRFFRGPERFFKQIRTSIILDSTQVALNLLLAAITTGSASSGGCKDASLDPHADKDGYPDALPPFCRDKRASAAFFWLSLAASGTTLAFCLVTFVRVRRSAETTAFTPPLPLAQEDAGAHFPRDADDEADPTWTAATAAGGRPSYDLSRADLDPGSAHPDAGGSSGGYRPSHDFADDAERLFAGHAPGYGVRDPFEDQDPFFEGRGETRSEAHSAGLDPYEAIRQVSLSIANVRGRATAEGTARDRAWTGRRPSATEQVSSSERIPGQR